MEDTPVMPALRSLWLFLLTAMLIPTACAASTTGLDNMLPMSAPAPAPSPVQAGSGRLERLVVPSRQVEPRPVDVWLPPDFEPRRAAGERFAVVYMHDGQMLFDARSTWNHQAWEVDRAVSRLMAEGRIPPTLVVGVWNAGPLRHSEYMPQRALDHLLPAQRQRHVAEALQGQPRADAYLRFLVEELKPVIDARYPTRPGPESTVVIGSSMGGLISVYALCEYPQVFGGAAGLSTHWVGKREANAALPLAAMNYLRDHLPDPAGHRLYQDHGTTELDALYAPYQPMIDQLVRDRGYGEAGPDANFMTRVFDGTGHNERAWADRVAIPLEFLLRGR